MLQRSLTKTAYEELKIATCCKMLLLHQMASSLPQRNQVQDQAKYLMQFGIWCRYTRRILPQYNDVVRAFKGDSAVRFTPLLLSRSIAALQFVKRDLRNRRHQSLEQFKARVEKYSSDATAAGTSIAEQRGIEAENSQKNEEISS